MSIMSAITFWYTEIKNSSMNRYELWVTSANRMDGCVVKMGFFCLEDMEPFS